MIGETSVSQSMSLFTKSADGKPERPYRYVKFRMMKTHRKEAGANAEEKPADVFLRVDGCHNNPDALTNYKLRGLKAVGYGNLCPNRNKEILQILRAETEPIDPRLFENIDPVDRMVEEQKKNAKKS